MMDLARTLAYKLSTIRRIRTLILLIIVIGTISVAIMMTRDTPRRNKTMRLNNEDTFTARRMPSTPPREHKVLNPTDGTVAVLGTDIAHSTLKGFKETFNYLLILPRATRRVFSLDTNNNINAADKNTIARLVDFLNDRRFYDGASCLGFSNTLPAQGSCYFETRNWTLLIGKSKEEPKNSKFVECNIIEHAFLIRRNVFERLYLNPSYGATTLLDFYLRSKGKLKIAGFTDCSFTTRLNRRDRGGLEDSAFFTDYIYLGNFHHIVRIVRENEITWTKCTYSAKICPEKPFNRSSLTRKLLPICCSHVLDKMLHDVAKGLNDIGVDYRIVYGTLLGAVRSETIIPWTKDLDISLKEDDYFRERNFKRLEKVLRPKNYAVPVFKGQRRVIPLFPPVQAVKGSPFDPKFQNRLFGRRIIAVLKRLLSSKARWQDLGYLDFYIAKREYFQTLTTVKINGQNYSTFFDMKQRLKEWYGPNFNAPIKKQSAPNEIDIVKRRKQRKKAEKRKRRKRRKKRNKD